MNRSRSSDVIASYLKKLVDKEDYLNDRQEKQLFELYKKKKSKSKNLEEQFKEFCSLYIKFSRKEEYEEYLKRFQLGEIIEYELIERFSKNGRPSEDQLKFFREYREIRELENKIIEYYGALTVFVVKSELRKMKINNIDLMEDLIQEGNIGLLTAMERYDPDMIVENKETGKLARSRFSAYAIWRIWQAVRKALDDIGIIRVPKESSLTYHKIKEDLNYLELEDLKKKYNLDGSEINRAIDAGFFVVSLEEPMYKGNSFNPYSEKRQLKDFISNNSDHLKEDIIDKKVQIHKYLSILSRRERKLLELRFGLKDGSSRTLEEIGNIFNLTRERIRQIEEGALKKIRMYEKKLKIEEHLRTS